MKLSRLLLARLPLAVLLLGFAMPDFMIHVTSADNPGDKTPADKNPADKTTAEKPEPKVPNLEFERREPYQGRSVVVAKHGIVATSQPLAAQAGLDVLKRGGNAADAAIAANAMIGLVEPMSCGIGGDLFLIYWDAKTQKLYALNASGRSPYKLTREIILNTKDTAAKDTDSKNTDAKLKSIPEQGALAWSVPGCVSGWEELNKRFGTLPLGELLAPAVATAREGFPVSEIIAGYWKAGAKPLSKWPDAAATYLPGGESPKFGEIFRNPRLAATYELIGKEGAAAFYRGSIAKQIVAFSEKNGGYFSLRDFSEHKADWIEPVSTNYRGYDVWELPPAGQGIAVLQMLNLLEPHDLAKLGPKHPQYLHLLTEAKKLAYADRARYYADPSMVEVPTAELISKEYAARRAKLLSPDKALQNVPPGDPKLKHGDTIYLTVVDKDRNCCSLIQSNYFGFGSKMVPGDLGFVLQNRGCLFSLDEHHPNRLEPHKRPFHTIIPAMVTKNGKPWFSFGVMGGDMQPQGHVQVLVNLIDFKMNVQAAGDAARVRHDGTAEPTGDIAQTTSKDGGTLHVESGIPDSAIDALRAKGHTVKRASGGFGGYQGIFIDWENGSLHGGSETRNDGAAVGY